MADGAGTPYCTQARLNQQWREDTEFLKGHEWSCASLWQGKSCDCWKAKRG